ncbi:MarR family transcriptional regulator [Sphingobacterium sp. ML3W]|uniref:MarR family winged helix-turn-helix transcriptional regulator n=1 Tax=Sphingobacterium sp. ML3W TaxID=1538644 RepID=UPI00249C0006|nr:helix-turn-helix domain-containing protein [Sphingobacterium sp. ML3W]WFA82260.1 MarR family transcriptional regulator [Sphingobacterium sp. ML3W]
MKYKLLEGILPLIEQFEADNLNGNYANDAEGFKRWVVNEQSNMLVDPHWEGKENGRSPESVISTLIVHMNRFAKSYSKAAIWGSHFSTQEEFIYLITLKSFGQMTKMELIKRNIHEKPVGMAIINRLLKQGWVSQEESELDKRSKVIYITETGLLALEQQMGRIRHATRIVSGDLTNEEKMILINLLTKLSDFHQVIYDKNIAAEQLLDKVKI